MTEPASIRPFRDRSGWLVFLGILELCFGLIAFGFVLIMALAFLASSLSQAGQALPFKMYIPGLMIYLPAAVGFMVIGIGSIRAKRWARALMLVFSWIWLAGGALSLLGMAFLFPRISKSLPQGPPFTDNFRIVFFTILFLALTAVYIIMPLIFILFYGSPHVKATCEARNTALCWTDRSPLPALGLSILFMLTSVVFLTTLSYNAAFFFFGTIISGWPGATCIILAAALFAYLSVGTYRRLPGIWMTSILSIVLFSLSTTLTFLMLDMTTIYETMGFPAQILLQTRTSGRFMNDWALYWSVLSGACFLGYIWSIRKYFLRDGSDLKAGDRSLKE
jgi:hypothetical protein